MRTWLDLCRLRAAPQQLPASTALLALALVNYCLVGIAVALPGSGWSMALLLTAPEPVPAWAGLSWLVLLFWSLAVRGHILRHALEITFGMGLLVSAGYALVLIWLVRWWLPAPVAG
jgi:hypothetical protein